jgi:hypothetical protein
VNWNKDLGCYEPCATCLEIALDAAYSGGFSPDDEEIEEEIGDAFGDGTAPILDVESYRSVFDHSDAGSLADERFDNEYT